MSKYTPEQVLHAADLEQAKYDGDLIISGYLRDYAALLRERESAKTKSDPVAWRYRLDGDMQWQHTSDKRICMGEIEPLYAVAPMLALAPYRAAIDLATERCLAFRAGALWALCNPRCTDEPVELYVSRSSNDYADTPWNWDRDASQAMLASARVLEVWVCSNPKCNTVHSSDPHGHCPTCIQENGSGWSTARKDVL